MMISKKLFRAAPCCAALGAAMPLPLLDAMVPSLTALQLTPASRGCVSARSMFRTA